MLTVRGCVFIDELDKISGYPKAKENLLRIDPHNWSKAFFSREVKRDSNQNNISEVFNEVDVVLTTRTKHIYSMLEDIRRYMMNRFHEKRIYGASWKNDIGPHIQ